MAMQGLRLLVVEGARYYAWHGIHLMYRMDDLILFSTRLPHSFSAVVERCGV